MVRIASIFSTTIGLGLISLVFLAGGIAWPAIILVVISVLLIAAHSRKMDWAGIPGLFLAYGFMVAGLLVELRPGLLFVASFFSIIGWDLADLSARIRLAGPEDDLSALIKAHFVRLGITFLFGGTILFIAYRLPLGLSFSWSAILAVLAALGLAALIRRLLERAQDSP